MGHRVYFPQLSEHQGGVITVAGEEAHHALRVKRLAVGDPVELCDGAGRVAVTRIEDTGKTRDGWLMTLAVERLAEVPRVQPYVRMLTATPKGERLDAMIDGLSQVGAGAWTPLKSKRSVIEEPSLNRIERLERIAVESLKQCGRAWALSIDEATNFADTVKNVSRAVIAHDAGGDYVANGADSVTVLIGPEGGWEQDELDLALSTRMNVRLARFGPHIMRTEVAAVVAAAQVLAAEQAFRARAV